MAITITTLAVDKDYLDGTKLTEGQLDAAFGIGAYTSTEDYCNTQLRLNIIQGFKDAFGDALYTLNNDGVATRTWTLFNKQYATKTYNGGNINLLLVADAGWQTVDAVNAATTFTPETAGQYKVTFEFTHKMVSTATTECTIDVSFRITDTATAGHVVNSKIRIPQTAGGSGEILHPVSVSAVFDWTAAAKTVLLQKYNRTVTAVGTNAVAASGTEGELFIIIEKL